MDITPDLLDQAPLGTLTRLTLGWPAERTPLRPGQWLTTDEGLRLWPMMPPSSGRIELLSANAPRPGARFRVRIDGAPLPLPDGPLLLAAEGLGLAPLIHLCASERAHRPLLAMLETASPPLFRPRPSRFILEGLPPAAIAAVPLLEDWGIPSRIASPEGLPGCYEGGLEALLPAGSTIVACGGHAFLARIGEARSLALRLETAA
ncbi:MAG: hypothetical protein ACOZAQ_01975 [Pseudomonadota bacterium]